MLRTEFAFIQADRLAVQSPRVVPCVLLYSQHSQVADSISECPSLREEMAFRFNSSGQYRLRFGDFVFMQIECSKIYFGENDFPAVRRKVVVQDRERF